MASDIKTEFDFEHLKNIPLNTPQTYRLDGTDEERTITVLENSYQDSSRWYEIWQIVWHEHQGDTYAYLYEVPATEKQETYQEFDPSDIYQVTAHLVQRIEYKKKTA